MPYASISELPPAVKERYSPRCQSVFMRAFNAHDGDEASRFKVAHTAAGNCKAAGKASMDDVTPPTQVKAQLIDDDHFRLLAIPFGGPLGGRDLDGEYFSRNTDIKPDWFTERPVLWHHGQDRFMADTVIGKATDLTLEDDGWWVDVWIKHGEQRADLVKRLASKAPIFGSSGTISYLRKSSKAGEILVWPYVEQTLTTSPQNPLSVSKPAKAWLSDFDDAMIPVQDAFKAVLTELDNLGADLPLTSHLDGDAGDEAAKAGRVLSARNERALRELVNQFLSAVDRMVTQPDPDPPAEGDAPS
jgi:cation transport regulator ChaB